MRPLITYITLHLRRLKMQTPKAHPSRERGAVLLMTLLVMTLMASLSVTIMQNITLSVKRSVHIQSHAQADWYIRSAENFAQRYISSQLATVSPAQLNVALLQNNPIIFPIEGGAISLSLRDGSQCLSLGALKTAPGQRQFRALLQTLDWSPHDADSLTDLAIDWQDADTHLQPNGAEDYTYLGRDAAHRTANTDFTSPMELRVLLAGNEEAYQTLRPFICARPSDEKNVLNVNTLAEWQAPLLAAALGGQDYGRVAQQLITDRPSGGFDSLDQFLSAPALNDVSLKEFDPDVLTFAPAHIWVEAEIIYQGVSRSLVLDYALPNGNLKRVYRRFTPEARRPVITSPQHSNAL